MRFSKNDREIDICTGTVFLLSAAYMFHNLWSGSLYAWDEAWYGAVAKEIIVEGKGWLTLHYNYQPWFQKPPLYIWMVATAYKVFGVNEFAVRIWSALLGFGSIVLVYLLTKDLFLSKRAALFSSLTLAGFAQFIKQSKMGMMDVPLTFFILIGIYFFWLGRRNENYFYGVGISTGIAFMIKSFAALQLPIIVLIFALIAREWKTLINRRMLYGFLIGFLICVPWHLYQYVKHESAFVKEYFLYHIFMRTFEPLEGHQGNIFYYLEVIVSKNFPVGAIGLVSVFFLLRQSFKERDTERKNASVLIITSVFTVLVLFSLVRTKLQWYIVPLYPFLSISAAVILDLLIDRVSPEKRKKAVVALLIFLTLIPCVRFLTDKSGNLDYSRDLKRLLLVAKNQNSDAGPLFRYDVPEEPVLVYYSERRVNYVQRDELMKLASTSSPFMCLLSKKDGFFQDLKNEKYGLTTLDENYRYILYRRI